MSDDALVVFDCIVARVSTLADGGLRVAFDLPENAIAAAALLMAAKAEGEVLLLRIEEQE